MTPEVLQDELVEEIKKLFAKDRFKTPTGQEIPINVFAQNTPVIESDDDDDPVPYIIVRINNGEDSGVFDSKYSVKIVVIIGLWDDDLNTQGHRRVMHIINVLYKRFMTNPNLNNKYVYDGPFKWLIQEDGYYPYYFGAIEMNFTIPAIRREDPLV